MSNPAVRLPEDWRRFDITALTGAILLALLLGLMWLVGAGPWDQQACSVGTRPAALDLSRDEGRILLMGSVATAAEKIYGQDNVTDRIKVDPEIVPIGWTGNAGGLTIRSTPQLPNVSPTAAWAANTCSQSEVLIVPVPDSASSRQESANPSAASMSPELSLSWAVIVR